MMKKKERPGRRRLVHMPKSAKGKPVCAASEKQARYWHQPILALKLKSGTLVFNAWSKLDYTIRNEGFGAAQQVLVKVADDRFEGQGSHSQTLVTIAPQKDYQHWLDVLPKAYGTDVPMQLVIEYKDPQGNIHLLERTVYVPVTSDTQPITGSQQSDSQAFARLQSPDGRNLAILRQNMVDHFNKTELHDMLFDFGLRADDFDTRTSGLVRELITWAIQNGRYPDLIALCQQQRPQVRW